MHNRVFSGWLLGVGAVLVALGTAHASLVKPDGGPPLVMPNTLLVEAGEKLEASPPGPAPAKTAKIAHLVADAKRGPRTCSAAAVRVPQQGIRIVTARHCADHRQLEVLDEHHRVTPLRQVDAEGNVDLSILEMGSAVPWEGLEMRSAASVAVGERLCAWRMRRDGDLLSRERICARLDRRQDRPGADPLLVLNHPYPAGTSGSALVDREGRIVGIVIASTGYEGLAEPIEGIQKLLPPPALADEVGHAEE